MIDNQAKQTHNLFGLEGTSGSSATLGEATDKILLRLSGFTYFDKESGLFVSHCLELDLVATGHSIEEAEDNIFDVIKAHLEFAFENNNWDNVYRPAPAEIWAEFAKLVAGRTGKPSQFRTITTEQEITRKAPHLDLQLAHG